MSAKVSWVATQKLSEERGRFLRSRTSLLIHLKHLANQKFSLVIGMSEVINPTWI
jgi:hypothetical protein